MRRLSGYGPSLVVLITTALILWAGPKAVKQLTYHQTRARILQAGQRLEGNDVLQQLNQAYRDIADFVEPSVVHISASQLQTDLLGRERAAVSSGSGWVYDIDGHIVTNFHVVENANRIEVQLHTGELRDAELVGFDQFTDIAVLKTRPGELHPATLAEAV